MVKTINKYNALHVYINIIIGRFHFTLVAFTSTVDVSDFHAGGLFVAWFLTRRS